jgi:hypothetical protein
MDTTRPESDCYLKRLPPTLRQNPKNNAKELDRGIQTDRASVPLLKPLRGSYLAEGGPGYVKNPAI